jgi:membrane protein DedA with SNARE-associated domain
MLATTALHALALLLQPPLPLDPPTAVERLEKIWQYVALGGSSIITEELAPVLGGIAAHERQLGLLRVMIACAVGSWLGMLVFYFLGRWRGRWAAARWPKFGAHLTRILGAVRRRPWRSSIATRFALGARWVLPAACGAAHVPLWLYLTGSAISALLWAPPFTLLGWAFGETAVVFVDRFKDYGAALTAALVLALALFLLVRWRRRRALVADDAT